MHYRDEPDIRDKGLSHNAIGLVGSVVVAISTVAPVYTLTGALGPTVREVGLHLPAVFLIGFIPMLLVAFAYRELNKVVPDAGTSFTWTVKAFGPRVGWMTGWGLVMATIIVLSNLAGIGTSFFYLTLGKLAGSDWVASWDHNKAIHIPTTMVFIAAATAISYRGMTVTKRVQYFLVILQLSVLALFIVMAVTKAQAGDFDTSLSFSAGWLNPFGIDNFAALTAGLSLSIFMYWGWDTALTMNEETAGGRNVPGRAAMLTLLVVVTAYLLTGIATLMVAGVGDTGLGLNTDNENIFAKLADPVMGSGLGTMLYVAVLASSVASLQTTFIPVARTALAMATYEALPPAFARVHPKYRTPGYATIVAGVVTGVFYTVMTLVSTSVLQDTIAALGLMICFYYALTAFSSVRYFRHDLLRDPRDFLIKGLMPLAGGLMLGAIFVKTLVDAWSPGYGSGSSVLGVGSVFVIGVGVLVIGVVVMEVIRGRNPRFFRGEVLKVDTPVLVPDEG
ncbi:APC family permease [Yinghuangia seranimata]|uniref:APC family permease n=1 Tax=Yinghuangia seranimata TaxID=408067 RepID=UPI00248CB57B|nr:APC family permease [Yinghuangia seranimata]MDI2127269.1 APC family permease [Yinghuangia seranimata]MDI2132214.1 APC family permease [Yinghuangia seranimata]